MGIGSEIRTVFMNNRPPTLPPGPIEPAPPDFSGEDFAKLLRGAPFTWGTATSAYQIEGAWNEHGKGPSIWDDFVHRKKRRRFQKRGDGDFACDHYHRLEEDLDVLRDLGVQSYRFSLSWPRVLPEGTGKVNQPGLDFYNRLVDGLLKRGIQPYATLYHWDLPLELENKGGWANRDITKWFANYCQIVGQNLGDRVKNWIVLNEPMIFLTLGYLLGVHAPGKRGLARFLAASHHTLLAQAEAARGLRSVLPTDSQIGTTISCTAGYPSRPDSPRAVRAWRSFDALMNRLYVDPVVGRDYPLTDLPTLKGIRKFIQPDDMKKIRFDFDFWGINNYTSKKVLPAWWVPWTGWRQKWVASREKTQMGWEIYPRGLFDLLMKFASYPEISRLMVTENGAAFEDQVTVTDQERAVHDPRRIDYLRQHLWQVYRAREAGCPVDGYFVWSLMDNFEWAEGLRPRFGLVHIDYADNYRRTIKDSGLWYRDFIRAAIRQ